MRRHRNQQGMTLLELMLALSLCLFLLLFISSYYLSATKRQAERHASFVLRQHLNLAGDLLERSLKKAAVVLWDEQHGHLKVWTYDPKTAALQVESYFVARAKHQSTSFLYKQVDQEPAMEWVEDITGLKAQILEPRAGRRVYLLEVEGQRAGQRRHDELFIRQRGSDEH